MEDLFFIVFGLCAIALYFAPAIIAYKRDHSYRHVILGLNIIGFVGVLPWIGAFVWAVWPDDKSIIDPIAGNVTGKGRRNAGDAIGAAGYGLKRGYEDEERNRE